MSTRIMSACWTLEMPPTAKAVLISLADNANDDGFCWPSIPTICKRTCFSERAVHRAIQYLEDAGIVTADRADGRHTKYMIHPDQPPSEMRHRQKCATADAQEPPQIRQEPPQERQPPPQQMRSNRKEPSVTVKATEKNDVAMAMLPGVTVEAIKDFLVIRKAKKAPLTETAAKGIIREAAKAGITLQSAIETCCERGWSGFKAEWITNNSGVRNEVSRNLSAVERVRASAIAGELADNPADWSNGCADLVGPDGGNLRAPLDI